MPKTILAEPSVIALALIAFRFCFQWLCYPLHDPIDFVFALNASVIAAADYVVWRDSRSMLLKLPNDLTPGSVTLGDYNVWRGNFGRTCGSGSQFDTTVREAAHRGVAKVEVFDATGALGATLRSDPRHPKSARLSLGTGGVRWRFGVLAAEKSGSAGRKRGFFGVLPQLAVLARL